MVPIFEYECECGYIFDELVIPGDNAKTATCPLCGSKKIKKKISTFLKFSGCRQSCSACKGCSIKEGKIWEK